MKPVVVMLIRMERKPVLARTRILMRAAVVGRTGTARR
jgi:hypothetical protein